MKYEAFLTIAAALNRKMRITPLLFGSLGLERRLGKALNPDDIDVLIPERYLKADWQRLIDLMRESGYALIDEEEHEFARGDTRIAYASIENLAPFAGVDIQSIPEVMDQGASYL